MRGQTTLRCSRRALSRVVLPAAELNATATQLSPWIRAQSDTLHQAPTTCQPRHFSTSSPSLARPRPEKPKSLEERAAAIQAEEKLDRRYTLPDYMQKTGRDRLPRDHEITDPQIMVLDGGAVEGPLATRFVMSKLTAGESLRMIQPYKPANDKEGTRAEYALCKIVDIQEEYKAEKERKDKKKKEAKPKTKEVELSWGISEHDLVTKTRQLGTFLEKGFKVEVVLGKKKGGRKITEQEAQEVLKKVRHEVEARNGMETKPPQGDVGGVLRLMVESKVKP